MSLLQQVQDDLKIALKAGEREVVSILRMAHAALKNKRIELRKELQEAEVLTVLKQEAKKLEEALEGAVAAGRDDLIQKAKRELEILKTYLPEEMDDEELARLVQEVVDDLTATAKDTGRVIGAVMQRVQGKAGGGRVRDIVERLFKDR
jgi:uncharacterized protein YqeY